MYMYVHILRSIRNACASSTPSRIRIRTLTPSHTRFSFHSLARLYSHLPTKEISQTTTKRLRFMDYFNIPFEQAHLVQSTVVQAEQKHCASTMYKCSVTIANTYM